jgi:peptide/nickel transport system substrate-binding protein
MLTAAVALTAGTVSAFAGGASATTSHPALRPQAATGGIIKFGETPGSPPNYIFPETSSANQSLYNNSQFINLMYPLLYLPDPNQPVLDYNRSMALPPVWSNHDTVVTVKLRNYVWSDGVPVTSKDIIFYINLAEAMGTSWGNYAGPTQFPYDLKSYKALNASTVQFVLKSPINPTFFDDNGLDYITPMPQHAWDKTSVNGAVGNYDSTPSGAKAVLKFLQAQAANTTTYSTNPLWQVVDGAWLLKSFGGASSPDIFVPNPHFSGTRPKVAEFEELPFTSDTAEFTALRGGTSALDYAAVPHPDVPAIPAVKAEGFNVTPTPVWGFNYIIPNTKNPAVGPILSQPYMRQVLEHLTDQQTMIKRFQFGYGVPTYGPTPIYPKGNPFVSTGELHNPYPYSVGDAEGQLRLHGWQVNPGGVDVCLKPGPTGCGAGVTKGEKLSLNLIYSSGTLLLQEQTDLFQSDAAQAGVQINPRAASFNTVISQVQPCVLPKDRNNPTCTWQLGEYGGISLSTYPSGEGLFNTGGAFNAGGYSNPLVDKLINETSTATSLAPYKQYENIIVHDVPWIWQPVPQNLWATAKNLTGYGLTSEFDGGFGYIEPQYWFFK